jgi:Pyruvate/2-oxoacid:ferredoxin oxidoreductase delta subunit
MEANMSRLRDVIRIDEDRCNGCGECALSCAEGAIAIIDGKARLVSETYCDGLGACIGECPQGALTIKQRVAEEFDEEATARHLAATRTASAADPLPCGCPAATAQSLPRTAAECGAHMTETPTARASHLTNWPVQISLLPPTAPYLRNAHLLISADCVPFAFADFHRRFLAGKVALVGCPKLDDAAYYRDKLADLFRANDIESIEVAYMEVPCCSGLVRIVQDAVIQSGKQIPITLTRIAIRGEIMDSVAPVPAGI